MNFKLAEIGVLEDFRYIWIVEQYTLSGCCASIVIQTSKSTTKKQLLCQNSFKFQGLILQKFYLSFSHDEMTLILLTSLNSNLDRFNFSQKSFCRGSTIKTLLQQKYILIYQFCKKLLQNKRFEIQSNHSRCFGYLSILSFCWLSNNANHYLQTNRLAVFSYVVNILCSIL